MNKISLIAVVALLTLASCANKTGEMQTPAERYPNGVTVGPRTGSIGGIRR